MKRAPTALLTLLALPALLACGTPAAPRIEAHLDVIAPDAGGIDAGATDAGSHGKSKGPWTLISAREMCWARGPLTYCAYVADSGDASVVSKPTLVDRPPDYARWHVERDGSVRVTPPDPDPDRDPKQAAKDTREYEARKAIAKKIPALTRLESTWQFGCGLLPRGDVTCWAEPKQMVNEAPVVAAPALVPNAHDVTDFFLRGWSTLCVLTRDGAVLCSPRLPVNVSVCVLRADGVRCGEQATAKSSPTSGVGMTVSAVNFDPRTQLTRPLVAVPDVVDARAIASYASQAWYDNLGDRVVAVDVKPEGGCAVDGKGAVSCWERDACPKGKDWSTQKIAGLADVVSVALGIDEGYALDKRGRVYGWSRPPRECHAPAPEAKPIIEGARQIHADMFSEARSPATGSLACAAMLDETVRCWRKLDEKPVVVQR